MNSRVANADNITALQESISRLTVEATEILASTHRRKKIESQIKVAIDELTALLATLDPIAQPTAIFDPSNPEVVGRFVALALVAQERNPLAHIPRFYGSGVYAIYYKGSFPAYQPISGTETPIYVGQASPAISNARSPSEQGPKLCGRLTDHRKNIGKAASTLQLADFEFRSLVVQSGWETAAEDYLIHLFSPIWNSETNILYGLGKHGDSATTRANRRSPWDTLHPGRAWAAASTTDAKSILQINNELDEHFAIKPVYKNLDTVLRNFIEELRQA
jgi:Eco29kI restriction endonuclease